MAMAVGDKGGLKSDMNVTPLIDVLLVLLVIFMVIAPLGQMGYEIQIPRESNIPLPPTPDNPQIILAVNAESCDVVDELRAAGLPPSCVVFLNKQPVPIAQFETKVAESFKNRRQQDKILFLAAEEKLNYEAIVRILDMAKSAVGEDLKVGIVTDERIARMES